MNFLSANKLVALVGMILISTQAYAQKYSVQGNVLDSLDNGVELATVLLLQKQDSVMAGFSITNPKGRFKLDDIIAGDYILNITFLGYHDINKNISISASEDLGFYKMKASAQTLENVLISASHIPIKINNDTVQYNAVAFKTQPADNVEELLKKLPGIEVEDDGTIRAHGEEVENVLVEGKEFFGSDPTIATKNLPADIIDNVQVFDKRSDMAEFSGIDDGEREKTINLVLKEGKKAGYFGTATIGGGTDDRYEGKINVNRFTKNTQLSALGMFNNVNKQGFSFREYIDFMGGLGNLMSGGGSVRFNTSDAGIPIANGLGDGFVNTGAGGLNYNVDVNKNLEINSSYFYNRIKNDIHQEVTRQSILERGGFATDQIADLVNINKNHRINSKIVADLDSTQKIIARISAGWNDGNATSNSSTRNLDENNNLVSGGKYDNLSLGDQLNVGLNMTYMKKFKKQGRFLSGNMNLGYSDNDQNASLNSINMIGINNGFPDTLTQEQIQSNQSKNYTFKISLTEPLGKRKYLELNASRQNNKNDFDKDFYDLMMINGNEISAINDQLSNSYNRDYSYNRIGLNFKFNRNRASLTTGLSLQHSDLNGTLRDEGVSINQDYFYVLPSLFYNKDISASRSLTVRYSTSVNEPSLEQLQPQVDNTDPLNIYIGNPALEPSYRHRLRINYNSFSQFSNIGFFSYLSTTYTNNSITNTRTIDEFFIQTTKPINTDYSLNSSLYFNFNAPLKFIKQRINISNNLTYSDNILFVNGLENSAKRINDRIRLSIDNWSKEVIDLEAGTRIGFNTTAYSENSGLNQSYIDHEYFLDLDIDFGGDWNASTFVRHNIYSGEEFGNQISLTRWEASVSRIFLTSKKLRVALSVFDILDQNQNINRTSNLNYIQDERIESLGRYFLLSLSYSFSGFGEKNLFGRGRGGGRGHRNR